MKTRAECLEKYGSDYFIEKKIKKGEAYYIFILYILIFCSFA